MESTGLRTDETIALVDCNNFYVSCERVFKPRLQDIPVAVLSNNDGCIVSRSNEIKALKIPMGAPGFKYEALIRQHNGVLLSSNYALYGDMSARVMDVLSTFTPQIELYSIDEAFLKLNGMQIADYEAWGRELKRKVFRWTGIPVSVGVSKSKTLAKIANHHAKRYPAFKGALALLEEPRISKALEMTDVGDVWGIGRQYQKFLKQNKIENARQLREAEDKFISHYLTVMGRRTVMELRGFSCIELDEAPANKKSIVSSRSFGRPVNKLEELQEAVSSYTSTSAAKLRAQGCVAGNIGVFLSTNRFKDTPQYNNTLSCTLEPPTAYSPEMVQMALKLLEELYLPGFEYQKAGVILTEIIPEADVPLSLYETNYLDDRRYPLMQAMDKLNHVFGRDTLTIASSGTQKDWQMKRRRLSPRYTTSWQDLPKVK